MIAYRRADIELYMGHHALLTTGADIMLPLVVPSDSRHVSGSQVRIAGTSVPHTLVIPSMPIADVAIRPVCLGQTVTITDVVVDTAAVSMV